MAVGLLLSVLTSCATSDDDDAAAKAERFVASVQRAGLAPRLTAEVAESLYGTDADAVCDAFDGSLGSAAHTMLFGNPSGRRHKTITTDSVEYALIVVETYCPDNLEHLRAEIADLDPFEPT